MPKPTLRGEFVLSNKPSENTEVSAASPVESEITFNHKHKHNKPKFYSSLVHYPDGVTFQSQEADEEVVLLVRRDLITNVPWIISVFLLSLVPPFLFITGPIFFPSLAISEPLLALIIAFYYLALFSFTLLNFAIWYFNVGIVTDKRAIDIDVPNILVKMISEARLASVVDVSFNQVGGIRSIFDYGDIYMQTEGIHQNIEFDRAPNPNMIRKVLGELMVDEPV